MTNKQKVLVGMLSLIMIGGVVLSMWLDFTPPQWKNVAGVQGRYFLPFLPMLVLMLKGKQTSRNDLIVDVLQEYFGEGEAAWRQGIIFCVNGYRTRCNNQMINIRL